MKYILTICAAGIALVLYAVAEEAPQTIKITLDPEADFVRDLRESTAAPVLGWQSQPFCGASAIVFTSTCTLHHNCRALPP